MGVINLGNIRFNWRGQYDSSKSYNKDDVVCYKGSSFIAKKVVTGNLPVVGDNWDLMAAGSTELTNKGDLVTHNGDLPARLPVGSDAQTLQVIDGMPVWRSPAAPPSRFVKKLQTVSGTGGSATRVYLMADGTIKACGTGDNYSNGDAAGGHRHLPSRVAAEDDDVRFVEVFSGFQNHYALTENGEVWSWGNNAYGQLGHGDKISIAIAKRIEFFVDNNIKIKKVFTNRPNQQATSCAYFLTTTGLLYACGNNTDGNLGNGTTTEQTKPVRCGSLTDIVDMSVSGRPHTCYAIQSTGDLWVWGWNGWGQLGLGDTTNRATPILHPSIKNVTKVYCACGYRTDANDPTGHGLVLKRDGTIWGSGYNGLGTLGVGDTTNRSSFTQISLDVVFVDIAGGDGRYGTSAAITDDGELYTWGQNGNGRLGIGNTADKSSPQKPAGAFQGHVTKVKFGGGIAAEGCILQAGNQLWAAGYSAKFNLGTGSSKGENSTFKKVRGISGNIIDWGAFGDGYVTWGLGVLYDDGRVDACGANTTYGETGTQSATLHDVGVLTNVIF